MNIKITPTKLKGSIDAIPSKSHAHRVLIACKLSQLQNNGPEKTDSLEIPTFSEDIAATKNCLIQLDKEMPFLDCKESGSTLRLIMPVAMALKKETVFIGSGKLPYRPLSPLKEEMENHGCRFIMGNSHQKSGDKYREICTVKGRLQPGEYKLAGNVSSQFISGLLFALPLLEDDSTLSLTTELQSAGYVDLTLDVLDDFGITISERESADGFKIYDIKGNQRYLEPNDLTIEGDWSNAAFWLACGALGGDITCRGLSLASSQRDKQILRLLGSMGADIDILTPGENAEQLPTVESDTEDPGHASVPDTICTTEIHCTGNSLDSVEVSVEQIPDLVPVLAVLMSLAEGASMITDAGRLKIKESDRLRTVFDFLSKLGADITHGGESLSITGLPALNGGEIDGYNDHRIVMAAAVASCGCENPMIIRGAEAVKKSYPGFFEDFAALGGKIDTI